MEKSNDPCEDKSQLTRYMDLTGMVFGRLTVIRLETSLKHNRRWKCLCQCGNYTTVTTASIVSYGTQSCGCLRKENASRSKTTHGLADTSEYNIWLGMIARCYNPNNKSYQSYGGRGIKVCDRWVNGFINFIEDMGFRPSLKHTIERVDVNGNYEPSNCKWATSKEQNNNRRNNHLITIDGVTLTISQASEKYGVKQATISRRLRCGWPPDKAVQKVIPLPLHEHNGLKLTTVGWSKVTGISYQTLNYRIEKGLTIEEAINRSNTLDKKRTKLISDYY